MDWHVTLFALAVTWLWPASGWARAVGATLAVGLLGAALSAWPPADPVGAQVPVRGKVRAVAFSPDGARLAIAREYGTLEIRDPASGRLLAETLAPGTGEIAFAADPQTLAIVAGKQLVLRTPGSEQPPREIGGHQQHIRRLAATPTGHVAATLDAAGRALLHRLPGGEPLATLEIDGRGLSTIDISPDGRLIVGGTDHGRVTLWETATSKPVRRFDGNKTGVLAVAFSPDGQRVAAAASDGTIRVWNVTGGRPVELPNDTGRAAGVLRFHPDGRRLAAATISTVRLWDLSTHQAAVLPALPASLIDAMAFSPDGRQLAVAGSEDRDAWIVDVDRWQVDRTVGPPR